MAIKTLNIKFNNTPAKINFIKNVNVCNVHIHIIFNFIKTLINYFTKKNNARTQ
jgi:hypothetical protein